jgi:Leucine-rich repeat (LRR) protein
LHLQLHSSQNPKDLRLGVVKKNLYLRLLDIRLPPVGYTNDVLLKKAGTKDCKLADRQLKTLTSLRLDENEISDIQPLAGLTNLTTLYFYWNKISDIQPLAGLTNLTILYLDNNKISDIQPLAGLTNLTKLYLSGNPIAVKVCPIKPESICTF